jgi:hypothetical protein
LAEKGPELLVMVYASHLIQVRQMSTLRPRTMVYIMS